MEKDLQEAISDKVTGTCACKEYANGGMSKNCMDPTSVYIRTPEQCTKKTKKADCEQVRGGMCLWTPGTLD